jgi:Ca2+/Na+ antiporter
VPSNATVVITDGNVVFAKIALQNIPAIINGITTSTSIIVAVIGVVIVFMVRELFQSDKKAKRVFFGVFIGFIYIFNYLFWVYVFLATGVIDLALRWSLDGLLLSFLFFVLIMLLGYYRLDMLKEREAEKTEPEENEQEKLKREFQHRAL